MQSIAELQALVCRGETDWSQYGDVKAVYHAGMVLFNYTPAAQYAGRWNWFERVSRGLILDTASSEVLARPFNKFWNWGERGRKAGGHIVTVTEKYDGSLGILYRRNGDHLIATRGSFTSEQALWATDYINTYTALEGIPDELTLLFEIIYPDNRIVVDYEGMEEMILLAARNRKTGAYLPYYPDLYQLGQSFGFVLPRVYTFNNIEEILAAAGALDANREGWVVEMSDGSRWKIKGDAYIEIHRLVAQASYRRVAEAILQRRFEEMTAAIPDELLGQIYEWRDEITQRAEAVMQEIECAFARAPQGTRKEFALYATGEHKPIAAYLFAMLDGRDVRPMIFRNEFGCKV